MRSLHLTGATKDGIGNGCFDAAMCFDKFFKGCDSFGICDYHGNLPAFFAQSGLPFGPCFCVGHDSDTHELANLSRDRNSAQVGLSRELKGSAAGHPAIDAIRRGSGLRCVLAHFASGFDVSISNDFRIGLSLRHSHHHGGDLNRGVNRHTGGDLHFFLQTGTTPAVTEIYIVTSDKSTTVRREVRS